MYLVVVTLLFQLLAKHGSAALPCQQVPVNTFVSSLYATPTSLALQLQTCLHCLILGLKQTIDSTRLTPLSINKLTTEFIICLLMFRNSKYRSPRNKIEALVS